MPRKRNLGRAEDGDYDPYESCEDEGPGKQRASSENHVIRSSRGRLVKVSCKNAACHAQHSICSCMTYRVVILERVAIVARAPL